MMHYFWSSLEEVLYCFSRSSVKFQVHRGQKKSLILTRIKRFWTVTWVRIYWWIWDDAQSLMYYRRGALLFFEVIHQISRSHRLKNLWFESNLSEITRPVAAIKSLRFALLNFKCQYTRKSLYQPSSAATLYFFLKYCTLSCYFALKYFIYTFLEEKAWNTFFILYWKDFTSIFQDGDSRPYWVLLPSKIEEWSHLVNLLVRSTCTLALRMELESSSDTIASKVCIVIWNKVLGEYL